MSNILKVMTAQQGLKFETGASFADTEGRTKPLKDKAKLLPSGILGSPFEYAKDLAGDIASIGKAAKGKANDHELGRINDLAMKLGSLGIASYLFIKNPFKLSKVMEFAGFGAFFGAMALWPKLFIQAPLKARTGVDFRQQYIDSYGRKKMLYQDPQYVLTDLLPRKDLDITGKKLGVAKRLPDRDNFIKQRAQKTALQANTLWMMTAGFASPVMAALMCNAGEKVLKPAIENYELNTTRNEFKSRLGSWAGSEAEKKALKKASAAFAEFLKNNADKTLDEEMANLISDQFTPLFEKSSLIELDNPVREYIKNLSHQEINGQLVERTFGSDIWSKLSKGEINGINKYCSQNISSAQKIAKIAGLLSDSEALKSMNSMQIKAELENSSKTGTVGEAAKQISTLYSDMLGISKRISLLNKYIDARIGDRPGSFIANQWERFSEKAAKSLSRGSIFDTDYLKESWKNYKSKILEAGSSFTEQSSAAVKNLPALAGSLIKGLQPQSVFTNSELKRLASGDADFIVKKIEKLAGSRRFNKTAAGLMRLIDRYELLTNEKSGILSDLRTLTEDELTKDVKNGAHIILNGAKNTLGADCVDFTEFSKKLAGRLETTEPGTLLNNTAVKAEARVLGAKASFYRFMQALDIFKQAQEIRTAQDGTLKTALDINIANILALEDAKQDPSVIERINAAAAEIREEFAQKINEVKANPSKKFAREIKDDIKALEKAAEKKIKDESQKILTAEMNIRAVDKIKNTKMIERLKTLCKSTVINASASDYIEKLTTRGFTGITKDEYKTVMDVLYGPDAATSIRAALKKSGVPEDDIRRMLKNLALYKASFIKDSADWINSMRPDLASRVLNSGIGQSLDGARRNDIAGKNIIDFAADAAKELYKPKKWRGLFGGIFTVLAAVTIGAVFMFGRKSRAEQQAEIESRKNG